MRARFAMLVAIALVGCTEGDAAMQADTTDTQQIVQLCVQCHGNDLEGNRSVNAPPIAGLEGWYVEAQLTKFRDGTRGTHFDDLSGMQMRPMAMSLTVGDIKRISAEVAARPRGVAAPVLEGGDAAKGKVAYAPCTACHGAKGEGNQQLNAPALSPQADWYLLSQLRKFKHGVRGANPADITGAQMMPMAQTLADEQTMKDVVAHVMTLR